MRGAVVPVVTDDQAVVEADLGAGKIGCPGWLLPGAERGHPRPPEPPAPPVCWSRTMLLCMPATRRAGAPASAAHCMTRGYWSADADHGRLW